MKIFNPNTKKFITIITLVLSLTLCTRKVFDSFKSRINDFENFTINSKDKSTLSYDKGAIQYHLEFDVDISMDKKQIDGKVQIHYKCLKQVDFISLDIRELDIYKVLTKDNIELNYKILKNTKNTIGDALIVTLNDRCYKDSYVEVYYRLDGNKSIGVHFSDPFVLHNKNKNITFMYTHGEAIYARSIFPCQDTPSLKVTSTARIRIPDPYTAIYSGEFVSKTILNNNINEFYYRIDVPVATYLMSFVAGEIVNEKIPNSRCEVWAESEVISLASSTFKNCEDYIKFYEKYSPFSFGQMVFIIAPNDFPFSGMENPYSTLVSEAVLSTDGSFSSTIAHEIAHFWTGNMVTNQNWDSFWLNEGITTYLNRKAFQAIHGEDIYNFELYNGLFKLESAVKEISKLYPDNSSYRSLTPEFNDDPYKFFSRIPYEKGSFFMYYLEKLLSEDNLNKIISAYFKEFAFKSITTDEFVDFFKKQMELNHLSNPIKWDEWLKGVESIPEKLELKSKKVEDFKILVNNFKEGNKTESELKEIFINLKISEKNRILSELIDKFQSLPSNIKEVLKSFISDKSLFSQHIALQSNSLILEAQTKEDKSEKSNLLLDIIANIPFYKVLHLRKIFSLLKEINPNKIYLFEQLNKYKKRYNPLTYARLTEFINK